MTAAILNKTLGTNVLQNIHYTLVVHKSNMALFYARIYWLFVVIALQFSHFPVKARGTPRHGACVVDPVSFNGILNARFRCFIFTLYFMLALGNWKFIVEKMCLSHFILCAVDTFWVMSLVGIFPSRSCFVNFASKAKLPVRLSLTNYIFMQISQSFVLISFSGTMKKINKLTDLARIRLAQDI